MKPTKFDGHNKVYGAPEGWDSKKQGEIIPLYVLEIQNEGEVKNCISIWNPSAKDIEAFLAGRGLSVQILGGQPPICLYTSSEDGTPHVELFEEKVSLVPQEKLEYKRKIEIESEVIKAFYSILKNDPSFLSGFIANIKMAILNQVQDKFKERTPGDKEEAISLVLEVSQKGLDSFFKNLIGE